MQKQGTKKFDLHFDLASLQPLRELFHYFIDLPLVYAPASDTTKMFGLEMGNQQQSILHFEIALGKVREREDYDAIRFKKVKAQKKTLHSKFHGLHDLTVPVIRQGEVSGFLLTGPYRKGIPSRRRLEDLYRLLTGRQAHPLDSEFIQFVKVVLGTLELSQPAENAMIRFLETAAEIISGSADVKGRLTLEKLSRETLASELPHRYWLASVMGANRFLTPARWETGGDLSVWEKRGMGFEKFPDCALALLPLFDGPISSNPVEALLHKARLEHEVFKICRSRKNLASGIFGGTLAVIAAIGRPPGSAAAALEAKELAVSLKREIQSRLRIETVVEAGPVVSPGSPLFASFEAALKNLRDILAGKSSFEKSETEPSIALLLESKRKLCLAAMSLRSEEAQLEGERFLGLALRVSREDGELRHWIFSALSECLLTLNTSQPEGLEAQISRWRDLLARSSSASELAQAFKLLLPQILLFLEKPNAMVGHNRMEAAVQMMSDAWQHPPGLRHLARHLGFSEVVLSKAFKRHVGCGYHEFVRRRRLKEAEVLLKKGRLKLTQIAEYCGFADLSQFDRAFHGFYGVSPTQWMKARLKKTAA